MLSSKIIGNRITAARKKLAISQAQLAQSLFISPQAVGKWERGESMPDILMLNRLAHILGVDLNYFSESFQSMDAELTVEQPSLGPDEEEEKKRRWNMSHGNWVDADFSGLNNLQEKFSSSNIKNCLFIGSDLSGLLLSSNHVAGCDFSSSHLDHSRIKSSHLAGNAFNGCSLKATEFSGSYISNSDFSDADLTGAEFRSGGFEKNNMANAAWNTVSFHVHCRPRF